VAAALPLPLNLPYALTPRSQQRERALYACVRVKECYVSVSGE